MRTKSFFFVTLLAGSLFCGCEKPAEDTAGAVKAPVQTKVETAPFERFPYSSRQPLVLRFSNVVAPLESGADKTPPAAALTPPLLGEWSWPSDSSLQFTPKEGWKPKEEVSIDLSKLFPAGEPKLAAYQLSARYPAPASALVNCELTLGDKAPVTRTPGAELRYNFPLDLNSTPGSMLPSYLKVTLELQGEEPKNVPFSLSYSEEGRRVHLLAKQILRQDKDGLVRIAARGGVTGKDGVRFEQEMACELPFKPVDWEIKKEEEHNEPIPVVLHLVPPKSEPGSTGISPLVLMFLKEGAGSSVSSGLATSLTVGKGLSLKPDILGEWIVTDETQISFQPKSQWPLGAEFELTVDPALFPKLKIEASTAKFNAPAFKSAFSESSLYSDPAAHTRRQVVATLKSNFPLKKGEIERALAVRFTIQPAQSFDDASAKPLGFSVLYDPKDPEVAYIHTDAIEIPKIPGRVHLRLNPGTVSELAGAPSAETAWTSVEIPSIDEFYTVSNATIGVAKKPDGDLQRILTIETTEEPVAKSIADDFQLYLLPDCGKKETAKKFCDGEQLFGSEGQVSPKALEAAEKLAVRPVPKPDNQDARVTSFEFEAPANRDVFLRAAKGIQSVSGFPLGKEYRDLIRVEPFPKSLAIMHEGSLLSLSGDRVLGVSVRNVKAIEVELARVLPRDLHHLISVTSGDFQRPSFFSSTIALDQLTERLRYVESVPEASPGKTVYSSVDFSRFQKDGAAPRGLFLLSIRERKKGRSDTDTWHNESSAPSEAYEGEGAEEGEGEESEEASPPALVRDQRLVLLTDLGMLVKDTLHGEHEVFVLSFRSQQPVAGASVKLLGQNGVPVFTGITSAEGRVTIPPTADLKREKVPLLYTVEKDGDLSFLPFQRGDRRLNFSRFDVGGIYNSEEAQGLRALLFSDRGIYRPGEEVRVGIITRKRDLTPAPLGLPVELVLADPRGNEVLRRKYAIGEAGLDEFRWTPGEQVPTGPYTLSLSLIRKAESTESPFLQSVTFRVEEFQPDRLTVRAGAVDASSAGRGSADSGWYDRDSLKFDLSVRNLFGTAAQGNKAKGTMFVRPWGGNLKEFPGYRFRSAPLKAQLMDQSEELGETTTDESGTAHFSPALSRFDEDSLTVDFAGEAFEQDSGRSVVGTTSVIVSTAKQFLGVNTGEGLSFVPKGSERAVEILPIDPKLKPGVFENVRCILEEIRMVSALVKQPNGTFAYQSTPKVTTVSEEKKSFAASPSKFALKTDQPGYFRYRFVSEENRELNRFEFTVVGAGEIGRSMERNADLHLTLNKDSYANGEEIEVSIAAPFVGAGLVTIERDKVFASKWFQTKTNSSTVKITVPKEVMGNAYLSVAFVRSLESPEIYTSPLSIGSVPFKISPETYTVPLALSVPAEAKPGRNLQVHYELGEEAKLIVYAVDEGILQFARYKAPSPVAFFVPKRALEVQSFQILDLLLPDHKVVQHQLSSIGGDQDAGLSKFRNPFARKRKAPMAFWSGVIAAPGKSGNVDVPIPEYFNGKVKIIAVAVSPVRVNAVTASTDIRSDLIVQMQAPYIVAPGDTFELGGTVTNLKRGSGAQAKLTAKIELPSSLELSGPGSAELTVPEGKDIPVRFEVKAKEALGSVPIKLSAKIGQDTFSTTEELSIRPAVPLRTEIQSGVYDPLKPPKDGSRALLLSRDLFSEKREVRASISGSPTSVADALLHFLKGYPYGCVEQVVSRAFGVMLIGANPEYGLDDAMVHRLVERTIAILGERLRGDGSFGSWDRSYAAPEIHSVYVAHFLIEAEKRGYAVPSNILKRGLDHLRALVDETLNDETDELAQAYALYVLARESEIVTDKAHSLIAHLDEQIGPRWKDTATATFLAGALKLLHLDEEAAALMKPVPKIWDPRSSSWYLNDLAFDWGAHSIVSNLFEHKEAGDDAILAVLSMIEAGNINTFTGSFAVIGMESRGKSDTAAMKDKLSIRAPEVLPLSGEVILSAAVPAGPKSLTYNGPADQLFFYQLSSSGFDKKQPALQSKISIARELRNKKGEFTSSIATDDSLQVTLFIKADDAPLKDIALVELIPGGFELDNTPEGIGARRSAGGESDAWKPSYIDVQEDRLVFFGDVTGSVRFTYRLKPLTAGHYTLPAPYAEGMYDRKIQFRGEEKQVEIRHTQ